MKAGILDRRITIQSKSIVVETNGQRVETWSNLYDNIWSDPVENIGKEQTEENNRTTMRMVKFKTRYTSTITNEMRIVWRGEVYKIEGVKELGRRDGLMIMGSKMIQT